MTIVNVVGTIADKSAISTSRHKAMYKLSDGTFVDRETQKFADGEYLDGMKYKGKYIYDSAMRCRSIRMDKAEYENEEFSKLIDSIARFPVRKSEL